MPNDYDNHKGDELVPLDDQGKAPESRLKTARAARAIYQRLWEEDRDASHNRARIQAMIDGDPPYSPSEMQRSAHKNRSNLNFGEAEQAIENAMTAYVDLTMGGEDLVSVKTKLEGEDDQVNVWNRELSSEISKLLRKWGGYEDTCLRNAQYFLSQGISIVYWEDEEDWRWKTAKLGEFKFPRRTTSDVDELEIAFCRREISAHELYGFIKNEDIATEEGWDVNAVKRILMHPPTGTTDNAVYDNWEVWQERAKECDMAMTALSEKLEIIHCWVKEFDGRVSYYIFRHDKVGDQRPMEMKLSDFLEKGPEAGDTFLYKKHNRFESMQDCFVFFTYGTGNGKLHSIRGLGYKVFPHVQQSNRMHNQLADGSTAASTIMVKPTGQQAKSGLAVANFGPYSILNPNLEYVNVTPPNFAQNVLPAINRFQALKRSRTSQYSAQDVLPEKGEMTRGEVDARISGAATVSSVNQTLYYKPQDDTYKQAIKRMKRPDYPKNDKGGKDIQEMLENLDRAGVPREAFYKIDLDSVKAVRVAGAGSPEMRSKVYEDLLGMAGSFDPEGRVNLYRDRAATLLGGYDQVDRYLRPPERTRVSMDAKLANLENFHMYDGYPVPVNDNDLHLEHLPIHLNEILKLIQKAEEGAPLEEVVQPTVALHEHATTHLEIGGLDPFSDQEVRNFTQVLQQAGEIILNGTRALQAQQRKMAEEGGGEISGEENTRMKNQMIELRTRLQMQEEKHAQEMRHREEIAEQKRRLADAETQSKILKQV